MGDLLMMNVRVCELWNGTAIVRTLGKPEIKEVVYLEKLDDGESTFGLYSTSVASKEGVLRCEGRTPIDYCGQIWQIDGSFSCRGPPRDVA